jgi:hypothetical protein
MDDEQTATRPPGADLYDRLTAEFQTFKDSRGGATFDYITGEQCASRLNETLGFMGWSFRVLEHGIHVEADECWAMGELTVKLGEISVVRQQFGSQKVKRSRASGTPLDIGFDLKGAATDAMKKCASLIGVALYLYEKEAPAAPFAAATRGADTTSASTAGAATSSAQATGNTSADPESLICDECGETLTETRFKDQTVWSPTQLSMFGRRKHSRILCMSHYREANQAKRRAEEALQQTPF